MTKTARLRFRTGRDNSMVSELRTTIGDKTGTFVVLANPAKQVKPNVTYHCELIEMKSGKGFIVTDAKEVKDETRIVIEEPFVSLFVKRFGEFSFEAEPRLVYYCAGNASIKSVVDVLRIRAGYNRIYELDISNEELQKLADDFEWKCKFVRAGGLDKEIEDEITFETEGDIVKVYIKYSYQHERGLIATYSPTENGWEGIIDRLDEAFDEGRIIMPAEGYEAAIESLTFVCQKREKEYVKEVKQNAKKASAVGFTKSTKIVDGEVVLNQLSAV